MIRHMLARKRGLLRSSGPKLHNHPLLRASFSKMAKYEERRICALDMDRPHTKAAEDVLIYAFQTGYKEARNGL